MADEPTLEPGSTCERFRAARRDPGLAVLEGFHPLKHALRFGATILEAVTEDLDQVLALARDLAPDLTDRFQDVLVQVPSDIFRALVPSPPPTGVVARARRPHADRSTVLGADPEAPVVLLDRPSRLGNVGAAVRVAAAAGAAGVLVVGESDPWHPDAIRGAAGLQFALPVARSDELPPPVAFDGRPILVVDPVGEPLVPERIRAGAVLAFGSERRGLSEALVQRADARLALPMRPGVSSLNLAVSVAAVLYAWRLGRPYPDEA